MNYPVSKEIKELLNKKPLENGEPEKVKSFYIGYAEKYLSLKKKGDKNSSINLTDIITDDKDVKMVDHNHSFIRDIGRRMERTRDYTMYEYEKNNGQKEIVVVPLDRPLWEKFAPLFSFGGIVLGFGLSLLTGVLQQPTGKSINRKTETKSFYVGDSITIHKMQVMDSASK